jgi:hypothetical protein
LPVSRHRQASDMGHTDQWVRGAYLRAASGTSP